MDCTLTVGRGLQGTEEERHIRSKKALLDTDLERARSHHGSDKGLGVRGVAHGEADCETSSKTREELAF